MPQRQGVVCITPGLVSGITALGCETKLGLLLPGKWLYGQIEPKATTTRHVVFFEIQVLAQYVGVAAAG
jgi:hypothetical protein